MKYLVFLLLLMMHALFARAQNEQNYRWFEGSWSGIKSFTGARLGIRVLVRIEVDSVRDNRFQGRFIYTYPKDTIARLIKTFDGKFKRGNISLDKGKELYLLDPRSRSFWSDCAQCDEIASIYLNDSALVFKITTYNCGDSCNGETVFTKPVYRYDAQMQAKIKNFFTQDTSLATAHTDPKRKNKQTKTANKSLAGAGKKGQPPGTNRKASTDTSINVIKTTMSGQNFKTVNKDSLLKPAGAAYPTGLNLVNTQVVQTGVNTDQKEKGIQASQESFGYTVNNDKSLAGSGDKIINETTGGIANNVTELQGHTVLATDSLSQVKPDGEPHTTGTNQSGLSPKTTNINVGHKDEVQTLKESFNIVNNGKSLAGFSGEKPTGKAGNIAETVTSTQSHSTAGADSLPQANIDQKPPVADISQAKSLAITANIDTGQKEKNIQGSNEGSGQAAKNIESSTSLNNKNATGNIAETISSPQSHAVAYTDSSLQANTGQKSLTGTSQANPVIPANVDQGGGNNSMPAPGKNPAATGNNDQSLTVASGSKSIDIINGISKPITSKQTARLASIDTLQVKINRETSLVQSYQVSSSHITMELFDNGEIDEDIVSVYYNGKLIVNYATLAHKAITFSVDASATNRHHEFILIAENEGALPPNTALLRITAGDKQYKLSVSTSGTKNAKIAIDYKGE